MSEFPIAASEVAVLNEARTVLGRLVKRALYDVPQDRCSGIVYNEAQHAEHAVFELLNAVSSWGGAKLSKGQIHNHFDPAVPAK